MLIMTYHVTGIYVMIKPLPPIEEKNDFIQLQLPTPKLLY